MTELHSLNATQILPMYQARKLSPVEVATAVLEHIATWESHLNATFDADKESTLRMARESEARWQRGEPCGPLDGVPVSIKDNIAITGRCSPVGTPSSQPQAALDDAPPVARLRESGAVFICRTTMPDFGMLISGRSDLHGTTRNPWDVTRNTGGSSSGAGAAAAAGYGPLHLGTDIAGSVRMPASWCGVFGLKPSLGRIPIDPPYIGRVTGPMTRTVADAALLMETLSKPDVRDFMSLPPSSINWQGLGEDASFVSGKRIAILLDTGTDVPVDSEVDSAVHEAGRALEAAGAIVEPIKPWLEGPALDAYYDLLRTRLRIDLASSAVNRTKAPAFLRDWAGATGLTTAEDMLKTLHALFQIRATTIAATVPYDYVLSPTAPMAAIPAENYCASNQPVDGLADGVFTQPFNLSEQPAASVNCGYTKSGLPIGLQIVGRRFDDLGVLQMARAWEHLRGVQRAWPTPPTITPGFLDTSTGN